MINSLYIHIPFCRKKCLYCDFYSIEYQDRLAQQYTDCLCQQINNLSEKFRTIYIGGGTPTVLTVRDLRKLFAALKPKTAGQCEFTVEANPESLTETKLKIFSSNGVKRISIGVQSLRDEKLEKLGRIHSVKQAQEAVYLAKEAGIGNISIDLIFGLWQEDFDDWQKELKKAVKLPVKHISLYSLTYEKGTPLFKAKTAKKINPLNEGIVARMYSYAVNFLADSGFTQYEISNFSQTDYQCRHNLNYWDNQPYLGLGAKAVSYIGGVRKKYISNVARYIAMVKSGKEEVALQEKLIPRRSAKETAAIKIRTKEGIDFAWFKAKTGFDFLILENKPLTGLIDQKLLTFRKQNSKKTGIFLTKKGTLFCDSVSSAFL